MHKALDDTIVEVESPIPMGPKTVMVVEDEPLLRSILCRILQERGYFVLEAENGTEAFMLAHQFPAPIALLITDLSMPRMSGIDLANRMTRIHPETQVLLLSGFSDECLSDHGGTPAAFPFLQKPFRPVTLIQKVRDILG